MLAVALLLALITILMQFAMPKFRIMQKLVDRLNLVSREILTGIMPIRAFSREQHEEARFDAANTDLMRTPTVHQPGNGRHDALYDPDYERHFPAHRLVRRQTD